MMGALEAADGMLLFGISTAFIFTVMQFYYQHLVFVSARAAPPKRIAPDRSTRRRVKTVPRAARYGMAPISVLHLAISKC